MSTRRWKFCPSANRPTEAVEYLPWGEVVYPTPNQGEAMNNDTVYRVRNWPAVAVRVVGYPQQWEPDMCLMTDDDGNEWEEETGEGEWVDDTECGDVLVVMVGDDRKHRVAKTDLLPLDELDYCTECGQIGCCHDGRDR